MRYRYTKIAPHKSTAPWTRRPVLNLVLYVQRRNLDLIALLDSGAD